MNNQGKKGISLIVLVITIIVIVILAVSVILTLANNNPIENAKRAVFQNDIKAMQEELSLYTLSNRFVELNPSQLYADENVLIEKGEKLEGKTIKDVITSIKDKYLGKFRVIDGKLDYIADDNLKELAWANEILQSNSNLNYKANEVENSYNIELLSVKSLESLKIYGNSIQNGSPTPNTPIEVESVGEETENLFNPNDSYYSTPGYQVDDDGWVTMTYDNSLGTGTAWRGIYTNPSEKIKPNTTYTIIAEIEEISNCSLTVVSSNSTYNPGQFAVGKNVNTTGVHILTATSREDLSISKTMIRTEMVVPAGKIGSVKCRISVLEDTSITEENFGYVPYGCEIPVTVSGKNLANYLRAWSVSSKHDVEIIDNGVIMSYVEDDKNARLIRIPCKLKAGVKYRLSLDNENIGTATATLKASFPEIQQYFMPNTTVTPNEDVTFLQLYVDDSLFVEGLEIKITNIQVEEGDIETEYEPYSEPVTTNVYQKEPLRKVGAYTDYIDLVNKIVVRNVKGIRLTSDLNWTTAQSSDGNYYHYCEIDDILQTASEQSILCNAYSVTSKNTTSENNKICYREGMNGFVIVNNSYTTVEAFKSYLDENKVYVEYPINTTKELLKISTIILNKGTNIATVGTTVSPSKISSVYDQSK